MKSLALRVAEKYYEQNPDELKQMEQTAKANGRAVDWADLERTFGNWLDRLKKAPNDALATTNWCGKVTKAFFGAFDMKAPKTKAEMVAVAQRELQHPEFDPFDSETWTDTLHPFMGDKKRDDFKSPFTDESKHNGRPFEILGLSDKKQFDMDDTGPYYRIRFTDGAKETMDADPIEIFVDVGTVGGKTW